MKLVDTHCHLQSEEFAGNLDALIAEAEAAGVVKLVTASIIPSQWPESAALSRKYPAVECALGIHPWYIERAFEPELESLRSARDQGAVAIGEIGLDAKTATDKALQQLFFERQLEIAREIELPVVIHCRGAFNELLETLKRVGAPRPGGLVHSYSGTAEIVRRLFRYNLAISFGGSLTFRNSRKKREALLAAWPDYVLLETDAPDIPPVEAPQRPNVPANIVYNLRAVAEMLELPEEVVAETTTRNALRLFT